MNTAWQNWLAVSRIAARLGYRRDEPLRFLNQRLCGLWLIWIGAVILAGTALGGPWLINPIIFGVGYAGGMAVIFGMPAVQRRYSDGPESRFQANMGTLAIVLMFVLMALIAGRSFAALDFRTIWLGALLATALHFIPFAAVHGPPMLRLAVPLTINALIGLLVPAAPFALIAAIDGLLKIGFGVALVRRRKG
jgi:hypothetical protein